MWDPTAALLPSTERCRDSGNCCVAVAVAGDRWWDADQAFPVRGHGHTMEPALTGITLVQIPLLVSSLVWN